MKKSIKEKKMRELGEELIVQNKIMCCTHDGTHDNEFRTVAAQHAYVILGMLLGLADLDYYNPIVTEIREKQIAMFGEYAITNPYRFFTRFNM